MRSRHRIKQEMVPLKSNTVSNNDGGNFGEEQNFIGDKSDLA